MIALGGFVKPGNNMKDKKVKLEESNPICIEIKNLTDQRQEWNLFGFNKFNNVEDHGNHKHVVISTLGGIPYDSIFNSFASNKFIIGSSRFHSENPKNIQQKVFLHSEDITKGVYSRRQVDLHLYTDAYQFQSNIIDMLSKYNLTNETWISGTIEANSSLIFACWPVESFNHSVRVNARNV